MKYECPKCQGQLKYWEKFGFSRERLVNKTSGNLNKQVRKSNEYSADTHGLICINRGCGFEYNGNFVANKVIYKQLDDILDRTLGKEVF